MESSDSWTLQVMIIKEKKQIFKVELTAVEEKIPPPHVEFLQTQIHFVLVNELLSFPPSLLFFFF